MLVAIAGYTPTLSYIFGIIFMSFSVKPRDTSKRTQDLKLKTSLALSVGASPKQDHQVD